MIGKISKEIADQRTNEIENPIIEQLGEIRHVINKEKGRRLIESIFSR